MRKPILIGLVGAAGVGKDTLADALVAELLDADKRAFATPLYAMANTLLGELGVTPKWHDRGWKESPLPNLGFSPRRMLQTLGTEWGRQLNNDLWLHAMSATWAAGRQQGVSLIVPDVRFPNEAQWVTDNGGLLVRVLRPGVTAVEAHVSEQHDLTDYCHVDVANEGAIVDLRGAARWLVDIHRRMYP